MPAPAQAPTPNLTYQGWLGVPHLSALGPGAHKVGVAGPVRLVGVPAVLSQCAALGGDHNL